MSTTGIIGDLESVDQLGQLLDMSVRDVYRSATHLRNRHTHQSMIISMFVVEGAGLWVGF